MPIVLDARTATDHFPGIGRYVVNLARALAQVAPDLDITLLRDPHATSSRLRLPELPHVDCAVSPFSVRQQWQVPTHLRRIRAGLYHSPYYLMPYFPGVPTLFTCHDLIPLLCPGYYTARQRLIFRLAHTLAMQTASVTIAVSQSTRADLLRNFRVDPRRIAVIPEAADERFTPQSPERIAAVQDQYALPDRYVLYLGSNKPHKNLRQLVKAWQLVCDPLGSLARQLVIAGHWDERYPDAKQCAAELELQSRVTFVGPVAERDLPALYSGATLFVFPSQYEGFGLPVLEALACGTPVVCGNASSLPEVAGDAAWMVSPLDTEALAETMKTVLVDPELQQAMRERGLAQSAKFSWQQTARATLAVYKTQGHL